MEKARLFRNWDRFVRAGARGADLVSFFGNKHKIYTWNLPVTDTGVPATRLASGRALASVEELRQALLEEATAVASFPFPCPALLVWVQREVDLTSVQDLLQHDPSEVSQPMEKPTWV